MENSDSVDIKWHHEDSRNIRRFGLPRATGYSSMTEKLSEVMPHFKGGIYWKDEDGDFVVVQNDQEFAYAASLPSNQKLLRLFTFEKPKPAEATASQSFAPEPDNTESKAIEAAVLAEPVELNTTEKEAALDSSSHSLGIKNVDEKDHTELSVEQERYLGPTYPEAERQMFPRTGDLGMDFAKEFDKEIQKLIAEFSADVSDSGTPGNR